MREMTTMVYSFNELSDDAKKRALNEFRYIDVDGVWWEDSYDTIRTAGKLLGLEIGDIHFDAYLYCIFDASYEYVRGASIRKGLLRADIRGPVMTCAAGQRIGPVVIGDPGTH